MSCEALPNGRPTERRHRARSMRACRAYHDASTKAQTRGAYRINLLPLVPHLWSVTGATDGRRACERSRESAVQALTATGRPRHRSAEDGPHPDRDAETSVRAQCLRCARRRRLADLSLYSYGRPCTSIQCRKAETCVKRNASAKHATYPFESRAYSDYFCDLPWHSRTRS